jgi:hypothetical protein
MMTLVLITKILIIPDQTERNAMIQEYYSDRDTCFKEIAQARKLFGNPKATLEQYAALDKGLGLMFLYCPEDIQPIVEATMEESDRRRLYIL